MSVCFLLGCGCLYSTVLLPCISPSCLGSQTSPAEDGEMAPRRDWRRLAICLTKRWSSASLFEHELRVCDLITSTFPLPLALFLRCASEPIEDQAVKRHAASAARKELDKPHVATFQSKRGRRKTQPKKNLQKNLEKSKSTNRLAKYPIPSSQHCSPYGLTHSTRNVPCRGHGHVLGQLPGLPRPPRRQAARLVRAVLAPAQRPAAVRAASVAATAAAAAAHAGPGAAAAAGLAGEGAEARGAVSGLHGLGGFVAHAAVRDRRRAGVGRVPGLRRRVGAAQDPLRGRAAAGQHQGCGGGEGGRPAQWDPVHGAAGGRRRRAAARRPGGHRPAGTSYRRRDVRGHLRRREEADGARHGLPALHSGDVRGHRVRAAVHAERRQAAGGRPGEPGLRRGRRRLRGRARAGASRGDVGVRRAGRQGVHRAGLRLSSCAVDRLPTSASTVLFFVLDQFGTEQHV